jgi:hypothetical protein
VRAAAIVVLLVLFSIGAGWWSVETSCRRHYGPTVDVCRTDVIFWPKYHVRAWWIDQ